MMLAEVALDPGGVCAWLTVGFLAGWLAGVVMRGRGYGVFLDLALGLLGAFVGGFLFGLVVEGPMGFWGSIGVAFVGACVLIAISRAFSPRPRL
jgi:uncharacterized membrane protein YeaQ/YmgE (transglycosylase-associated protein family)